MNNKILVIIPYYRNAEALAKCMRALEENSFKNIEIFIRDNSNDNIYFTAAVNEGIRKGLADHAITAFLILNQDCYLENGTLEALQAHLLQFSDCGIACPLQVDSFNFVTWGGSLEAFPKGRHYAIPIDQYDQPFTTYWANGACMLIRRAMVEEIGILDKNMKFICSDSDYSFTARSRGWQVHVVPSARCEHILGSSSHRSVGEIDKIKIEDVIYFYEKWISGDLYCRLSYEGERIIRIDLAQLIDDLRDQIRSN
jgi:GT2 family glycosyltransferase